MSTKKTTKKVSKSANDLKLIKAYDRINKLKKERDFNREAATQMEDLADGFLNEIRDLNGEIQRLNNELKTARLVVKKYVDASTEIVNFSQSTKPDGSFICETLKQNTAKTFREIFQQACQDNRKKL